MIYLDKNLCYPKYDADEASFVRLDEMKYE